MITKKYKEEITKYLWKIPRIDFLTVNNVLGLLDNEMKAWDMLRSLRENENNLSKTTGDEVIKLALKVVEADK